MFSPNLQGRGPPAGRPSSPIAKDGGVVRSALGVMSNVRLGAIHTNQLSYPHTHVGEQRMLFVG